MKISEKLIREKKWNELKNRHRYNYMNGGYFYDENKGYIVKYNSYSNKKCFKKLNSHYKRQKIRLLLNNENYDNLNDKFEIDVWGWF